MIKKITNKTIIDVLVTAYMGRPEAHRSFELNSEGCVDFESPLIRSKCNGQGQGLWEVNYGAFNRAYERDYTTPEYSFTPEPRTPAEILAVVDLFDERYSESWRAGGETLCNLLRRYYTRELSEARIAARKLHETMAGNATQHDTL